MGARASGYRRAMQAMKTGFIAGLAMLAIVACPDARSATVEKYVVVASGEVVGSLDATVDGDNVAIAYQVSNNGRGPKLSERIVMGSDRMPISWTVDGTTAFGGRVAERFSREKGEIVWESQADRGRVAAGSRTLYIANDASPWGVGVYARALLRAPQNSLDVLPAGTLKLEKVRDLTLGDAQATVYLLV